VYVLNAGCSRTVYATCVPSGENATLYFIRGSSVRRLTSPFGSSFTYTWSSVKKSLAPRMNATMRPSGESAGAVAESVKSVNCVYCAPEDRPRRDAEMEKAAMVRTAAAPTAIQISRFDRGRAAAVAVGSAGAGADKPETGAMNR
jgi:hypothetical protein